MLHAHHRKRTSSDNKHHLPLEQIDERERQDEEEERDGLFEVDAEYDGKRGLDAFCESALPGMGNERGEGGIWTQGSLHAFHGA